MSDEVNFPPSSRLLSVDLTSDDIHSCSGVRLHWDGWLAPSHP